ncbi:MAG: SCP2 sterol-binding domain-containing protein [Candidatus Hodarchaeota archaeon]
MISIQEPEDIISLAISNILSSRIDDKEFYTYVHDWNKKIVLEIKPFYSVTIIFKGDNIQFQVGEDKEADIKLRLGLQAMLDIAYGREDPLLAVQKGIMELEGLGNDSGNLVKFYNIFLASMQKVANEPNVNYFELNKKTK